MALLGRRFPAEPGTALSQLMAEGRDTVDAGILVRTLARSIVHVPMPGAPPEPQPRVISSADPDSDGPPLYVVEDADGQHAFLFSTARRLVEAFGKGVGGASVPFPVLAVAWPAGVDVVLDPGHPQALEVPLDVLQHVLLEVAGVPTGTALQPSPGDRSRIPSPELAQLMGATVEAAAALPEVQALYRAETLPDVPSPRPVIDVHVELDAVDDDRLREIMTTLSDAASAVEPRPLRMTASVAGVVRTHDRLAAAVRAVDAPYYRRDG